MDENETKEKVNRIENNRENPLPAPNNNEPIENLDENSNNSELNKPDTEGLKKDYASEAIPKRMNGHDAFKKTLDNKNYYKEEAEKLKQRKDAADAERKNKIKEAPKQEANSKNKNDNNSENKNNSNNNSENKNKKDENSTNDDKKKNENKEIEEKKKNSLDKARDAKNSAAARMGMLNNKINDAKSKAYMAQHPEEAGKELVEYKLKELLLRLIKNPIFWTIIGIFLFLFVIFFVVLYISDESFALGSQVLSYAYQKCDKITVVSNGVSKSIDFEDYVAGVVTAESSDDRFYEAMKAQAIAARTYALYKTNNCQNSISNSTNDQVYSNNASAKAIQAAKDTSGIIMVGSDGKVIPAFFASYPKAGYSGFGSSVPACGNISCNATQCTTTLYKMGPNNKYQAFQFTMDRKYKGSYWNGADLTNQGGHCYGYSQLGARYLDSIGKKYDEILNEFFIDYKLATMNSATSTGDGLTATASGFIARFTKPSRSNSIYYDQSTKDQYAYTIYEGECAWYAYYRAQEILLNSTGSKGNVQSANGGEFCQANKSYYKESTDPTKPKVGALISWSSSQYGHVAVVEQVNSDGSIVISEGGNGFGASGDRNYLSYVGHENDSNYSIVRKQRRKANCLNTGCFNSQTLKLTRIKNYNSDGSYPFACYIYLLDD
jgi:surface antigen